MMLRVNEDDYNLIKELQVKLKADGIKLALGKVAGYAARKVLLK